MSDIYRIKKDTVLMNSINQYTPFKRFWKDRYLYLILLPVLIHVFIFCYLPMYGVLISFQNYQIGSPILSFKGDVEWVGFQYFIKFFKSIFFIRIMKNTILNSLFSLIFGFWVPIAFALILNEIKNSVYKRVVQTMSYLPHFISTVIVAGIAVSFLSSTDGIINRIIEIMGMQKIQFLNESRYFRPIYVILGIWQSFGWGSILYLANIASIDPGLYEASRLDGANRLRQIIHITLPGIAPTVTILLIFAIGGMLSSDSGKILLLYNPAIYDTADVIGTYTYRVGLLEGSYSYASAVGIFVSVINFILLGMANKLSRKTSDYGLW